MNNNLEQAVAGLIEKAIAGMDTATSFLSAEIPDVISQLLLWYGIYYFIVFLFSITLIVVPLCVLIKKCGVGAVVDESNSGRYGNRVPTWTHDDDGDFVDKGIGVVLSIVVTVIIGFLILFHNQLDFLKVWIAPKVWLIEYGADLVK